MAARAWADRETRCEAQLIFDVNKDKVDCSDTTEPFLSKIPANEVRSY